MSEEDDAGAGQEVTWVRALDAANMLVKRCGGFSAAKEALAWGLWEKLLQVRALHTGETIGPRVAKQHGRRRLDEQRQLAVVVTHETWRMSNDWKRDKERWDWEKGHFTVGYGDSYGTARIHIFGVHFARHEIEALSPPANLGKATVAATKAAPSEVVRARLWDWEPALIDLVILADLDGLHDVFGDLTVRGNQRKLEIWFADHFQRRSQALGASDVERERSHPSEAELRKRASLIVRALRQRAAK